MAWQYIRNPYGPTNLGAALGQGFNTGLQAVLSDTLEDMAQKRLLNLKSNFAEKEQAKRAQRLAPILKNFGLPEGSEFLPDSTLNTLLKSKPESSAKLSDEQLTNLGFNPQEINAIKSLPSEYQKPFILEKAKEPGRKAYANALKEITGLELGTGINEKQLTDLAHISQQKKAAQIKEENARNRLEYKESKIEERASQKESQKYFDETLNESEAAKKGDLRLDRMEHLIKKGSLPYSGWYNILKKAEEGAGLNTVPLVGPLLGTVVKFATEPFRQVQKNVTARDTEEYEKLQSDFIRDAKAIFGSRVTDIDLQAFMKIIPTLANTDAGKLQIIKNMKQFNRIVQLKAETMKKIIKENKGKRPANLRLLVDDALKPELDKAAEDFKSGTLNSILG